MAKFRSGLKAALQASLVTFEKNGLAFQRQSCSIHLRYRMRGAGATSPATWHNANRCMQTPDGRSAASVAIYALISILS